MSSNAEIIFAGNAKGLLDEYKKLEAANKKLEEQLSKQVKVARDNARSEEKLRRDVMRAVEAARTPVEKYNAALAQYKTALDKGMISQAQFNSVQKAASDELKKSADNVKGFNESLTASILKAGLIKSAFQSAAAAITAMIEEEKKIRGEGSMSNMTIDDMSRTYAIQAGIDNDADRVKSRDQIIDVARANGVKLDKAFEAATQLAAMSITDPKHLDSFLKTMLTTNLKGSSPKELVMAVNQFLEANNEALTGENMLAVLTEVRGLFKDTQVEGTDLTQMAQAAPAMSKYMTRQEQFGIFTALRQAMPAPLASTAAKNITTRLTAAKGTPETVKALAEMGLSPEDVDMVGESALVALDRLQKGILKLPEQDRAAITKTMFGLESGASATRLLESLGKIPDYMKSMKDTAGFASGVNVALGADSATAARQEIDRQSMMLKQSPLIESERAFEEEAQRLYEQSVLENQSSGGVLGKTVGRASIYLNKKIGDTLYSMGLTTKDEYIENIRPSSDSVGGGRGPGYRPPAEAKEFTEAELKSRLGRDPQMDKQTGVLQDISNKLTVRPVNPNLSGRP